MEISGNGGNPTASILIGYSLISHPFWSIHIYIYIPIRLMVLFDPIEAKHNTGLSKKNYGSSSQHLMVENETINVGHPIHGLHILGQTLEVD